MILDMINFCIQVVNILIEVSNLYYKYPKSDKIILEDLNFSIDNGEIFGFLGPSGAGKSTAQKVLTGLLKEYRGRIRVAGKEPKNANSEFYENIGICFEMPTHYLKLTGIENLRYFQALFRNKTTDLRQLLYRVGLLQDADSLVSKYSKGMKNRLSFARSLIHDPNILFLDEPTAGLDPTNARIIIDIIRELKDDGKTIFLTTHNMAVAEELCDRLAFIVDGRLEVVSTAESLKLKHGRAVVQVEYRTHDTLETEEFEIKGLGENTTFLDLLHTNSVTTIHSQEATLDQVFIKVTGRALQ